MNLIHSSIIYDNPLPQLRSRHSFFPSVCQCADGSLTAVYAVGQAFESVDSTSCASRSFDGGKSWTKPKPLFDKSQFSVPITDYWKSPLAIRKPAVCWTTSSSSPPPTIVAKAGAKCTKSLTIGAAMPRLPPP